MTPARLELTAFPRLFDRAGDLLLWIGSFGAYLCATAGRGGRDFLLVSGLVVVDQYSDSLVISLFIGFN